MLNTSRLLKMRGLRAMTPRSVSDDTSFLVAYRLIPRNYHAAHRRLKGTRQFDTHVIAVSHLIGVDLVHEAVLSISVDNYLLWMRGVSSRFILEVDVIRRNEDEGQNQRDHHVIVHAASLVGPEDIVFYDSADAHLPFQFRGAAGEW